MCRQHSQLLLQVADLAPELQDLLVDLGRRAVGAGQVLSNNWGHVTTTHTILDAGRKGEGEPTKMRNMYAHVWLCIRMYVQAYV